MIFRRDEYRYNYRIHHARKFTDKICTAPKYRARIKNIMPLSNHNVPADTMPQYATRKAEYFAGVRAELPLLLGLFPFGMVYGVLALAAGLPVWAIIFMSAIFLAGSGQLIFVQLFGVATPYSIIATTASIVNLRHLLYSASVAPYLDHLPRRWKMLLSFLLTDEAYAAAVPRFRDGPATPHRHWFLLGTGTTLWAGWFTSSITGILIGHAIPASWSLDFSVALTFIALLVMSLQRKSEIIAALAAAGAALMLQSLPYKLWILAAALIGIAVGVFCRRLEMRR